MSKIGTFHIQSSLTKIIKQILDLVKHIYLYEVREK